MSAPLRENWPPLPQSEIIVGGTPEGGAFGGAFEVGDVLNNKYSQASIGTVVRVESHHRFRDGEVGRAYIVETPWGTQMDMKLERLEERAERGSPRCPGSSVWTGDGCTTGSIPDRR